MPRCHACHLLLLIFIGAGCVRGGAKKRAERQVPQAYPGDQLPPPEQQGSPVQGGTLRVAMEWEPPSLNYQLDPLDGWAKAIHDLVYDNMAPPNPRTFEPEPRLAERWEISDDRLTFTFYLRKDVRWHDGKRFSADDVTFTFEKMLDPKSKTMSMRSFLEPIEKVEKIGRNKVRFHLKRPYWNAFDAIAQIYIYPKHHYEKGDFNTHPNNRAPIGTGSYELVHWITGDEILLKQNPHYFGNKGHLDEIAFKLASDPTVRVQLLRRGDIDVVLRLSPDAWNSITKDEAIASRFWRLRHVPAALQWVGWNQARPLFRDRRVRRALTMLLDREDIVENLRLGLDSPAVSWFYPGSREYNDTIRPWPYDPDAAVELLEAAGWVDSDGDGIRDRAQDPFVFTFSYATGNPFYEQLASLMQAEFKRAGIKVETSRLEWAVYSERLRRHEFDACSLLWHIYPRADPYQIWHSKEIPGGSNFISFRSSEVDRLLVKARAEFDPAARVKLYHRFSEILHEEEPYTMLFHRYHLSLVSKRFGGITSTPFGLIRFDDLYLRDDAGGPTQGG